MVKTKHAMKYKVILRGIIKKLSPQLYNKLKKKGTGGTDSAIYCYSVWLRHLVLLNENGMKKIPDVVAEIGPGDSLGIGLNALITGTSKYYAFDVIKHASIEKNLKLFDEIVFLYKNKTKIPNDETLKRVKPKLKQYDFPIHILNDEYMNKMLEPNRLDRIRNAIKNIDNNKGNNYQIYCSLGFKRSFNKRERRFNIFTGSIRTYCRC